MKNVKFSSMLVLLLSLFAAGIQAQTVVPSKKYITKEVKNVSEFNSIKVVGSPQVEYWQSKDSKTAVSIYCSENVVDLVEVSTVEGVLQVNIKQGVNIRGGNYRLTVTASSPSLKQVDVKGSSDVLLKGSVKGESLQLNVAGSGDIDADDLHFTHLVGTVKGSGDIDLKKVKATNVNMQVNGSGDIKVEGSALQATLTVRGSGDIVADELLATHTIATVVGSGDIECYASQQLDAEVRGSGDIEYKGHPSVVNKQGKKDQISRR